MARLNLYIHYDSVTNHFMTRGFDFTTTDFSKQYLPQNLILANAPEEFGRYDVQTDFKILRGQNEVYDYIDLCFKENRRMSNWIDFDSLELMHQLAPFEIAELLYLFHANKALKSPFFYKLQNNYVYLTMPNGLNKTYYRHMSHFYPRFQRVLSERVNDMANETAGWFRRRRYQILPFPLGQVEELSPLFMNGLKIDFQQAYEESNSWHIPLFIIEDQLTLLTRSLPLTQKVGKITYSLSEGMWQVEIKVKDEDGLGEETR